MRRFAAPTRVGRRAVRLSQLRVRFYADNAAPEPKEQPRASRGRRAAFGVAGVLTAVVGYYFFGPETPEQKAFREWKEKKFQPSLLEPKLDYNTLKSEKDPLVKLPEARFGPEVPGLYVCGSNRGHVISDDLPEVGVRRPVRLPFFDGQLLRDVNFGENSAVAVLENGDLVQWGDGFAAKSTEHPCVTVKGRNLVKARISNGCVYGLTKSGKVVYLPVAQSGQESPEWKPQRHSSFLSRVAQWKSDNVAELPTKRKIVDFATGNSHILLLDDLGKVHTAATGLTELKEHYGQFGLLDYPHFGKAPQPNEVHSVDMLNEHRYTENGKTKIKPREITQIAAGAQHSVALDSAGRLWTFGSNNYGQLGVPFSYETEIIPYPVEVDFAKAFAKNFFPKVTQIYAGGETTFAIVHPMNMRQFIGYEDAGSKLTGEELYLAFGKGLLGQLGTGKFAHVQPEPSRMKELMKIKQYVDGAYRQVGIYDFTVGNKHAVATMNKNSEDTSNSRDVYAWGCNADGQLGNGKRNNRAVPQVMEPLPEKTETLYLNEPLAKTSLNPLKSESEKKNDGGGNQTAQAASGEAELLDMETLRKMNARLQLVDAEQEFPVGNKLRKERLEQRIVATGDVSAIFYSKSEA